MNAKNAPDGLVVIAKIARSRGLRGELVADLLTDFPERFDSIETVVARNAKGETKSLELEKFWFQKNRVILKFKGFDSIEEADVLRDWEICVPESETVDLDEGEYFDWELENCSVETISGEKLGFVKEVMRTGGTENLLVQGELKDYLIPFALTICVEVDVENKRIMVDPPDGLLDF
jgi:16S rRNA processing protein RimM